MLRFVISPAQFRWPKASGVIRTVAIAATGLLVISATAACGPVDKEEAKAELAAQTGIASASPTPTATETSPALTSCEVEKDLEAFEDDVFVCTPDEAGNLVWMDEATAAGLVAEREAAAAAKAAVLKAAALKRAAQAKAKAIAAKRAAEIRAATARRNAAAFAERVAARQAQLAAEQRAQQEAQAQQFVAPAPAQAPSPAPVMGAYQNCSAARAAGAAPVYAGQPGYGSHLDRDNDGVGCE